MNRILVLSVIAGCVAACTASRKLTVPQNYPVFYKEGHRGTRGLGSKPYTNWPQQQKIKVSMPLLGELIDSVEAYVTANNPPKPIYNIELKTSPKYDTLKYNASPADVVKAVYTMKSGQLKISLIS